MNDICPCGISQKVCEYHGARAPSPRDHNAQIIYLSVNDKAFFADNKVECVDCGCALIRDTSLPIDEHRCDTDEAHYQRTCGEDCPIICMTCREHHFDGGCQVQDPSDYELCSTCGFDHSYESAEAQSAHLDLMREPAFA